MLWKSRSDTDRISFWERAKTILMFLLCHFSITVKFKTIDDLMKYTPIPENTKINGSAVRRVNYI